MGGDFASLKMIGLACFFGKERSFPQNLQTSGLRSSVSDLVLAGKMPAPCRASQAWSCSYRSAVAHACFFPNIIPRARRQPDVAHASLFLHCVPPENLILLLNDMKHSRNND
jgi:hypothetical protein